MSRYDLDNLIQQATSMDVPLTSSKQPRWQRKNDSQLYNSFNVSCLNQTNPNQIINTTVNDQQGKYPAKTPLKTPSKAKDGMTPAGKTPSRLNVSKAKTPKTPAGVGDRYIPYRQGMDLEISRYLVTQANKQGGQENEALSADKPDHNNPISEILNANLENYRIMCYAKQAPVAPEGQSSNLKVLYSSSKSFTSSKKTTRVVPSQPDRILDAPEIENDWYLNLVDWSDTNLLAVALKGEVYLWNAATGDIASLVHLAEGEKVCSVSWIQDGNHIAIGSTTNEVEIWDAEVNRKLRVMRGHSQKVISLDWNSYTLSSGSAAGQIFHHDVRIPNHHVGTLDGHSGQSVCGLKWSPDGKYLASGANDNALNIWSAQTMGHDIENNKPAQTFSHNSAVKAIAWCPWKHNIVASGGGTADRTVKIWNAANGNNLYAVDTNSQVCGVLWSEEHQELITGHGYQNYELNIWKYPGMTKVAELRGHTGRILSLSMSPDKSTVVSVGADETLRFWECFQVDAERKKRNKLAESQANPIRLSLR